MTTGGKPHGVYVITDAQLKTSVGGTYSIQPGPALRVTGLPSSGSRGISGGNLIPVYVVDATEAARRGVIGGDPIPIADLTSSNRSAIDPQIAIPIYIESGAEHIGSGVTPTPPAPASVYIHTVSPEKLPLSLSTDLDLYYNFLSGAAGTDTDMYADAGSFAPAFSEASLLIRQPDSQTPIGNDHWVEWIDVGTWVNSADDYAGCAVRFNQAVESYYGFRHDLDDYELYKFVSGSKTVLQSGAITPANGDKWRLEVEGTAIRVYRNEVLFESATDSDVSSGDGVGICTEGFQVQARIGGIKYGDLPYDTTNYVYIHNAWRSNYQYAINSVGSGLIDECGGTGVAEAFDNLDLTGAFGHIAADTEPHYFVLDLHEKIKFSRMRNWRNQNNLSDWYDVDIDIKDELADDWTNVVTGTSCNSGNPTSAWRYSPKFGPAEGRYVRVTINITADANNKYDTREVEFWSGDEDDLWWLADTITHYDCWGAWRAKGILSYWNARANANDASTGTNVRLNEGGGVVPWSVANGFEIAGGNYPVTQLTAGGSIDHTHIIRFKNCTGVSILGEAASPTIWLTRSGAGTFQCFNNLSLTSWSPDADVTDKDYVIAFTTNKLYGNGTLVDTGAAYINGAAAGPYLIGNSGGTIGTVDVVAYAIYNRELGGDEIAAITAKMQTL